jgi:hypothetical protein
MRPFKGLILSLSLLGLTTSSAWSQGIGPAKLIRSKEVQQELKVDGGQVRRITAISKIKDGRHREGLTKLSQLPEGTARGNKMLELSRQLDDDFSKSIAGILNPEQSRRFEQLQIQRLGAGALMEPLVEKALKLTDDQKAQILAINEELARSLFSRFPAPAHVVGEGSEFVSNARRRAMDSAIAVMTDDQKNTWANLRGEPWVPM